MNSTKADFRFLVLTIMVLCLSSPARGGEDCKQKPNADQQHGQRQLEQVLADRPDMQGIVDEDDEIYRWVISKFASGPGKNRLYWDNREPSGIRDAAHSGPAGGQLGYIQVTADKKESGVDKWCMLVFELHNIDNTPGFQALITKAYQGKVDGDTFSIECTRLEFEALNRTRKFFTAHPIQVPAGQKNAYYDRYMNSSNDFSECLDQLDNQDSNVYDPRDYAREYYESAIVPWRRATGRE